MKVTSQRCNSANSGVASKDLEIGIEHLRSLLLKTDDSNAYEIGDQLIQLLPKLRVKARLAWLADHLHSSASRLSECKCVAQAFPPNQRDGFNFQISLLAYRIHRRVSRALKMSLLEIRSEIAEMRGGRRYRQVRDHFIRKRISLTRLDQNHPTEFSYSSLHSRCVLGDFIEAMDDLPHGCARMVIADPPFGTRPLRPSAAIGHDCDHNTNEESLAITLALFSTCESVLADDGVLILFQPGMLPDRLEILAESNRIGFQCHHALTWLKWPLNKLPSRSFAYAYANATERILIFARKGSPAFPRRAGQLTLPDVISMPITTSTFIYEMDAGRHEHGDAHIFEKPVELCRLFVQNHSLAGDMIIEPFGCTAPASVAAVQTDREFLYIESNVKNFALGQSRIKRAIERRADASITNYDAIS